MANYYCLTLAYMLFICSCWVVWLYPKENMTFDTCVSNERNEIFYFKLLKSVSTELNKP